MVALLTYYLTTSTEKELYKLVLVLDFPEAKLA